MKRLFLPSAFAMLLVASCVNESKKEAADSTAVTAAIPTPAPIDEDAPVDFTLVEKPPQYPGGYSAFYKFIGDNLKYPETAIENKVEGSVMASFIIEKDGTLTNIKIDKKKLGSGTDEEAIRVLKLAKKWEPGISNGKAVRVKYQIPIKFFLNQKD